MPEVAQPLIPIKVDYVCDSCGQGKMIRLMGELEAVASHPAFKHVCDFCKTEQVLEEQYPITSYVNFYGFLQDASKAVNQAKEREA